jgi:N-acetyl-gamma-glutamyl-phosphate reductase
MEIVPVLLKEGKKVIDLSADYRIEDTQVYKKWYSKDHTDINNIKKAVYGLPELYKDKIKNASLIANPGCYPTAAILALAPLFKNKLAKPEFIIIDAKSGITGAGRKPDLSSVYSDFNENLKAYKINQHQHMPEIEEVLSNISGKKVEINFVPHLIPMDRGILETIYLKTDTKVNVIDLLKLCKEFYKQSPFVRINDEGKFPEIKDVLNTNFCDIGIKIDSQKSLVIIVAAIDNLVKGAAGQAVQNMNIMCGFPEGEALL